MLPKLMLMCNFIEDYQADKAKALAVAISMADSLEWCKTIDEDVIYRQMDTAEFRLYQEMICF